VSEWTPRLTKLEPSDDRQLQYANSLLRARRFDEAQAEALRFLSGNERSAPAQVTLGLSFLGQQRADAALDCFNRAIASDPLQSRPLLAAGFAHLQNRDIAQAEHCFREALNLDADLTGAKLGLAQTCHMRERVDEARQHLIDILARNPGMMTARLLLARLHDKAGDVGAMVDQIDAILERNPGQSGVVDVLSILFQHRDRWKYDEAIRLLESATRFNPVDPVVWSWLGRARLQAGHPVEAERAFREAIRLKPRAVIAQVGLTEALVRQGRVKEARAALAQTPRRRVIAALIDRENGEICLAEQSYEEAAKFFRAALQSAPGGRAILTAAEQYLQGQQATAESAARQYRGALLRMADASRGRKSEQEWLTLGRRFARLAWNSGTRPSEDKVVDRADGAEAS
jgi:tetratricopeptide (TPR) repeat protein